MMTAYSERSLISRIGSYLQIVSKDPGSTAFVPLAEAYRQVGLLEDALEVTRIGTQRLPHFSPGFSTMGRVLGQMGRIDEAVNAYVKALSLDHQSQSALVGLARLHLIRGERDQARTLLQQAREFHPGDEKITDMLKALDLPRPWEQMKPAAPEPSTEASASTPAGAPGAPIPTATLAEIYAKQGLHAQAIKIYQDILDRHPDHATAQERLQQLRDTTAPASPAQRSTLGILQSWLRAIQQRRADVS